MCELKRFNEDSIDTLLDALVKLLTRFLFGAVREESVVELVEHLAALVNWKVGNVCICHGHHRIDKEMAVVFS